MKQTVTAYFFGLLMLATKGKCSPLETESTFTSVDRLTTENDDLIQYNEPKPNNRTRNCQEEILAETEYVLLENGSLLLPQNHNLYDYNAYFIENNTVFICGSVVEVEEVMEASNFTSYNFSKEFLKCGHVLIEPHEYELWKNGTIHVSIYQKLYGPSDYYIQPTGVYICLPNYAEMAANSTNVTVDDNSKFPEAFTYVTRAGLGISIISLLLHLLVFCCVSKVRNLPGYCLASLSISLLIAYLCFVCSSFVNSDNVCANVGLCVYYFFLTSFFWMNTIAFDVWRSFRVVVRELRISSHRVPWRRFLLYSVYSWCCPAILAALARVADTTEIFPLDYRPSFGSRICWFGQRKAVMVFFATPLCLVMILNAIFFLDCAYVINRASIKTSQVEKAMLTRRFFTFMRLALLMGLTWIVGIVAGYANHIVLWYLFVVFNTLQGLFIFVAFSCSTKVRIFVLLKVNGGVNKRQSTSVRTISQVSGAL